jgi:protein SCO1/2
MHARTAARASFVALMLVVSCAPHTIDLAGSTERFDAKPAPALVLTDQRGKPFSLAAERGREVVVFFGYTHCPDVCPTTLANLEHAYRALSAAERAKIDIAFVTLDPERDSQARMAKYVRLFGPNIIGLRGNAAQLATVEKDWHVWHQRTDVTKDGYNVAHSSAIFFVAPNGDLVAMHDWHDADDVVGADLAKYAS